MGVDYSSHGFIGVWIPNPKITEKYRGCKHPEKGANFCPECGQSMWKKQTILHPVLEKMENDLACEGPLRYISSGMLEEVYVGYNKLAPESGSNRSGGRCASKVELPDNLSIPEIKKELKEKLGDLYDEKNFGLWAVLSAG